MENTTTHFLKVATLPLEEQIKICAEKFELDPCQAYENAKNLENLKNFTSPEITPHIQWFAIPYIDEIHCDYMGILEDYNIHIFRCRNLYLAPNVNNKEVMQIYKRIFEEQQSCILLIPVVFYNNQFTESHKNATWLDMFALFSIDLINQNLTGNNFFLVNNKLELPFGNYVCIDLCFDRDNGSPRFNARLETKKQDLLYAQLFCPYNIKKIKLKIGQATNFEILDAYIKTTTGVFKDTFERYFDEVVEGYSTEERDEFKKWYIENYNSKEVQYILFKNKEILQRNYERLVREINRKNRQLERERKQNELKWIFINPEDLPFYTSQGLFDNDH